MVARGGKDVSMISTALAAFAICVAVTPAAGPPLSSEKMAALVNGEPILESAVTQALNRIPKQKQAKARGQIIDYLAGNLLIDQHLRANGHSVSRKEVDGRVTQMKEQMKNIGRDFGKMLAELKINEEELRYHIAADLRWANYAAKEATDKQLRAYFNANLDKFDGSTVKARHILINESKDARKRLGDIQLAIEKEVAEGLKKLPAGTTEEDREKERCKLIDRAFEKAARKSSDCPSKASGGDVGWFQKAGLMVAPFADAAFALKPFQLSKPVQTPFGLHLILVMERKAGKKVKFEDVKDTIKEVYFDLLHDYLGAKLRKTAKVQVFAAPSP
jgi:peptidyl-prolyl cis-trans isomerase C